MLSGQKKKRLPLKTIYYLSFCFFIVIPLLLVLLGALLLLNQQFKRQAIENIERAQEAIIAELVSDIDVMSMRLSHMIYTNNNEILSYAAGTDAADGKIRYEYQQKLGQTVNLVLEPVKDIISVGFYRRDGSEIYVKNEIKRESQELRETAWYQAALQKANTVCVGSYDTASTNDLFMGGRKDMLVLVFALAPDVTTDRSEKIEMVMFYQSTGAAERIKAYNLDYGRGENKLGITQITDEKGGLVFSTQEDPSKFEEPEYTCVRSPIRFNDTVWYIESYIRTRELTAEYWSTAMPVLGVAVLILLFAGYYSRYFLRSIVKPVEEISSGLRQVEEGNLEVHIAASGQYEIRSMIHQFNAMVRRLKALIGEYEEKVRSAQKKPQDYLAAMIEKRMTPEETARLSQDFFQEHYTILGFYLEKAVLKEQEKEAAGQLADSFERNPRFASRCILYKEGPKLLLVYYRITEEDYTANVKKMAAELQRIVLEETGAGMAVCIGEECTGWADFEPQLAMIRSKMCLRHLEGVNAVICLEGRRAETDRLLAEAQQYEKLASALAIADEKNMVQEREKLFELFNHLPIEEARIQACGIILAIGGRFGRDNSSFADIFGQSYNYQEKIERIEEIRSLKLWLTNYFAWIMDYSASRLNVSETDVIVKAKRYLADYYEDADLSLARVAEHVGLNEKYFTNRFTRETGETFTAYLTGLRMQKARELLGTTSFKVYEIAEMSGYRSVEHFNRMFKKENGISPAQYRKSLR